MNKWQVSHFFNPLLGRIRSRGRCWAASRLSHRPEPSGHAVRGEVDGLDIGKQHGRRFVLLRHTHSRSGGHTPFGQAGAETSDTGTEAVEPDPGSYWEGNSGSECRCGDENKESCGLSAHSAFHWWSAHSAACMLLLLSDELMSCCATGTNECLDTQEE